MKVTYEQLLKAQPVLNKMGNDKKAGVTSALRIFKLLKILDFSLQEFEAVRKRVIAETGYDKVVEEPLKKMREGLGIFEGSTPSPEQIRSFQENVAELFLDEEVDAVKKKFESDLSEAILVETEIQIRPLVEKELKTFSELTASDLMNLGPFLKV